ncbi:Regulator of cytoskeleton and endocytosis like protein [Verticillium longisporum]|uniref:Regulator of cytoskeleton and endocytosis like protein n=1 Tax=Verticillium longisporum TaxID=100787 RepID=A0A8I2ZG52_VERLO|nr:Regulator of cytoskeleton and endocytosis like protein [Verticillium longisporum]
MSFRGFQKSVVRAPQTFKSRFNIGEQTKDAVYSDSERRFQELETETKKLHDESKKYFDAINGMLNHQIEFSKAMTEVYKPISGRMSDPDTLKIEGNPEGIRACEEYELVVKDLQDTLAPELDMIETRVIRPATELLDVIKAIRKTATKRDHKRIDYDRHRTTLKKLQDKKERSAKDEKALWKAEGDTETATQEFNYFNDLLGYFDLTRDIEEAFHAKRGDIQEQAEALSIVKFKTTGQRRPPKYGRPALEGPRTQGLLTAGPSSSSPSVPTTSKPLARIGYTPTGQASADSESQPPPPYSPGSPGLQAMAAAKGKPPPPKPKPSRFSAVPVAETVTALYDYDAQAEGDLSFRTGDVIEIITRTKNENEWWTGKLNGKQGQFPGNYVQTSS